ncbi:uncharacterized protein MCYG_05288 [Microsporum canis CBS 113480]|uniref:Uncharacterized protein n=1 Tax=Arthroderma otae (strain ATCC MYA-4605 / CBS 113480) TaxID=554155 RepID=C5FRG6_ARTOC|nr:uncharacterized protein MCYG_05288 [Microsporum canis CBS 113480]EEQ32469.1 predicted protein [Microsporum canis CBS 113480]
MDYRLLTTKYSNNSQQDNISPFIQHHPSLRPWPNFLYGAFSFDSASWSSAAQPIRKATETGFLFFLGSLYAWILARYRIPASGPCLDISQHEACILGSWNIDAAQRMHAIAAPFPREPIACSTAYKYDHQRRHLHV